MVHTGEHAVVNYRLTLEDGTEYANTESNGAPYDFVMGKGAMLPDFEYAVAGMDVGESISIHIPIAQAYGERDENLVVKVPATSLPNGDPLPANSIIGLQTPEGLMRVRVVSVDGDSVVLDCNHELAGQALNFDISLLDVYGESNIDHEQHAKGCACGCDRLKEALS